MEDLLMAVVTFIVSVLVVAYTGLVGIAVASVASLFLVGYLAHERARSPGRWVLVGLAIGPFAIPVLYLVAAVSAFRQMMRTRTSS